MCLDTRLPSKTHFRPGNFRSVGAARPWRAWLLCGCLLGPFLSAQMAAAQMTSTQTASEASMSELLPEPSAPESQTADSAQSNGGQDLQTQDTATTQNSATSADSTDTASNLPGEGGDLFARVTRAAEKLAAEQFKEVEANIPEALKNMDYSQYRAIRYRPDAAIWKDESLFELQLFHLGFLYREPVSIELVDNNQRQHLPFKSELFNYDGPAASLAQVAPADMGYAGFRVHYPLNHQQYKDEVLVFQGASYFRLVGPGQVYGLSARGLAIDTAASSGEEFPVFRKFWLEKPAAGSDKLVIHALLDSPSVTGAYRFELLPGAPTSMEVKARLFTRKDIKKLGVAPLTSMYHHGENHSRFVDDFRPEVHDSDGLRMQTGNGEWIWRPLNNPISLKVTSLQDTNPRGFGLMQRDRDFEHYLDAEADYERRPSFWVTPSHDWGKGRVELVEIPTDSETNDNIVAYWVPAEAVKAGDQLSFDYVITSLDQLPASKQANGKPAAGALATVSRTRIGWGALPGEKDPPPHSKRQFIVDFQGPSLSPFSEGQDIEAELELSSGKASDVTVFKLQDEQWRVAFKIDPEAQQPVDMRLSLQLHEQQLSEVWSYVWHPDNIQ